MENKEISIRQKLANFKDGKYLWPSIDTQIAAGWYDWFCKDTALTAKTNKLLGYLKKIAGSKLIDQDAQYVWFKNNCPMDGNLYDDFRIADMATGNTLITITPKSGHRVMNGKGEVWSRSNDFKGPVFVGTWPEIVAWFKDAK